MLMYYAMAIQHIRLSDVGEGGEGVNVAEWRMCGGDMSESAMQFPGQT